MCFLGVKDVTVIFHIVFSPTFHYSVLGIFEKIFCGCFADIYITLQNLLEEKKLKTYNHGVIPEFFNNFLGLSWKTVPLPVRVYEGSLTNDICYKMEPFLHGTQN